MSSKQRERQRQEPEELIWLREEPGARRSGLSRQAIGEAAVRIADAEGFEAVSMRRVARELDAGTMSLYHYVENKEELLGLMSNVVMGELLIPDEDLPTDWRKALTAVARRTRAAFRRHPWVFDSMSEPGQAGPNGLKHFEQSMAAVSELRLPPRERLELIAMVDDYVFGFALRELLQDEAHSEGGDPDLTDSSLDFFEAQIATGEFPRIKDLLRGDMRAAMRRLVETFSGEGENDRRFERGLRILLDGIEAEFAPKTRS